MIAPSLSHGVRRRFSVVAALVAAIVIALLVAPAQAEAQTGPIVRATYENGSVQSGYPLLGFNRCTDCPAPIQTVSLARSGDTAVRHQLRYGDQAEGGLGSRSESHTIKMPETHFGHGDTFYYGFSIYVMSTWQTDSSEDIVFQWHNWPEACEAQKWPSAFLSIQPSGQFRLRWNSDAGACSTAETLTMESADLGQIKPGEWHDFIFKFDWSYGETGSIQVWSQTHKTPGWDQVASDQGPNTYNDAKRQGYLKWGIYKPAWNKGPTDVAARVLVHDNIAVGTTCRSVNPEPNPNPLVDPCGGA